MFIFYFYINVNLVKKFRVLKFFYTNKKKIIYQLNYIKDKIHSGFKTKKSF